jgi:cytoskeletal protein CcmA (bactofilin family)
MGRNSKPETPQKPETSPNDLSSRNQSYGYSSTAPETPAPRPQFESTPNPMRAMSDSESMARDIKEGRLSGFVGSGTMLTGETNFKAMLRVDGHLTGRVHSESGTLIVGTTGMVDANLTVASAVIHGTVNGDIIATERIELGRTAKVMGNIQTPSLMMDQGALLEGSCSMIKQRSELEKLAAQQHEIVQSNNYEEPQAEFVGAEMTEPAEETAV